MATMTEQAVGKDQGLKLEMTRVIKASRQRVFDAWTRPEFIRQWFGPEVKKCTLAETDPRVGGAYTLELRGEPCEGESVESGDSVDSGDSIKGGIDMSRTSRASGRYIKVDPFDLLQFTWKGDWEPDGPETLVTVALRDVEGGTEIKLTHERFATDASRDAHQHGWAESMDKLVRFLEK